MATRRTNAEQLSDTFRGQWIMNPKLQDAQFQGYLHRIGAAEIEDRALRAAWRGYCMAHEMACIVIDGAGANTVLSVDIGVTPFDDRIRWWRAMENHFPKTTGCTRKKTAWVSKRMVLFAAQGAALEILDAAGWVYRDPRLEAFQKSVRA